MSGRWLARARPWIVAALTIVVLPAVSPAQDQATVRPELNKARQYRAAGEPLKAAEAYREAAREAPPGDDRALALIELGALYDRQAQAAPDARPQIRRSADAFYDAMQQSNGELRLQAANNYATQKLRLGDAPAALEVLRAVTAEYREAELDPVAASRTAFNYGRALEQTGDDAAAAAQYLRAFEADPRFAPAEQAVARLALAEPSPARGIERLAALSDRLMERGNYEAAARRLSEGLSREDWWREPRYGELVDRLVHQLTLAATSPEAFGETWSGELARLAGALAEGAPDEAARLRDVDRVYFGELPLHFDSREAKGEFRAWQAPGGHAALSGLMKSVGDHYSRSGRPQSALPRYATAWALDTTNMEAGLYLASLLSATRDQDLLDRFLRRAFDEKQQAYLGEDWESILKFHTVLGSLFEGLEVWGPEHRARSAIFQWRHALNAHERLRRASAGDGTPLPAVRERLALALARDGQTERAWNEYAAATGEYVRLERYADAERAALAAMELDHRADPAAQQRLERYLQLARERG